MLKALRYIKGVERLNKSRKKSVSLPRRTSFKSLKSLTLKFDIKNKRKKELFLQHTIQSTVKSHTPVID